MYHIEKNTVQETLIIPLYGRKVYSAPYNGKATASSYNFCKIFINKPRLSLLSFL